MLWIHVKHNHLAMLAIAGWFAIHSSQSMAAPQSSTLTLNQVLSDLWEAPTLKKANSVSEEASWNRAEASSVFFPRVKVGAARLVDKQYMLLDFTLPGAPGPSSIAQVIPTTNFTLNADWLIFDGFGFINRFQSAKSFERAARAESEWTQFKTRHDLTLAYYKALAAKTLREVAEQNERTLQDHLNDARLFKKAGLTTNFDLLRVEVQLSEAKSEVANARDNEAMAILQMGDLTNQHYDNVEVTGQLPILTNKIPKDITADSVQRKDLQALGERVEGLSALASASQKEWSPKVALFAEYDHYNNRGDSLEWGNSEFRDAHTVGVQLTWTVFDGTGRWARQKAAAEKKIQSEYDLQIMKEKTRTALEYWLRKYTYFSSLYSARSEDVTKATESVRLAKEGRKVGSRTNTDLLDAESELFRARAGQVNAQVGTIEALINIEMATGRELYKFD
jgi:outer membrane protein TolC